MNAMTESDRMHEIRELIKFYDSRGWNWLLAAEFTLGLRSGELDRKHWLGDYYLMPKRGRWTEAQRQAARDRHRG